MLYVLQIKSEVAYANSKGIEVGGYDLIVWTRGVPEYWHDIGGDGACIASNWYVCMCVVLAYIFSWCVCVFVCTLDEERNSVRQQ